MKTKKTMNIKFNAVLERDIEHKIITRRIKLLPETKAHLYSLINPIIKSLSIDNCKIEFNCFQYFVNDKRGFSNLKIYIFIKSKNKKLFSIKYSFKWNEEHLKNIKLFQSDDYYLFEQNFNNLLKETDQYSFHISCYMTPAIPVLNHGLSYIKIKKESKNIVSKYFQGLNKPPVFESFHLLKNKIIKNHYLFYSNIIKAFNADINLFNLYEYKLPIELRYIIDNQGIACEIRNEDKKISTPYIDISSGDYTLYGIIGELISVDAIFPVEDYQNMTLEEIVIFNKMMNY